MPRRVMLWICLWIGLLAACTTTTTGRPSLGNTVRILQTLSALTPGPELYGTLTAAAGPKASPAASSRVTTPRVSVTAIPQTLPTSRASATSRSGIQTLTATPTDTTVPSKTPRPSDTPHTRSSASVKAQTAVPAEARVPPTPETAAGQPTKRPGSRTPFVLLVLSLVVSLVAYRYMIYAEYLAEETPFLAQRESALRSVVIIRLCLGALAPIAAELVLVWLLSLFGKAPSIGLLGRLSIPLLIPIIAGLLVALRYMVELERLSEQAPFQNQRSLAQGRLIRVRFAVGALAMIAVELMAIWTVSRFRQPSAVAAPITPPAPVVISTRTTADVPAPGRTPTPVPTNTGGPTPNSASSTPSPTRTPTRTRTASPTRPTPSPTRTPTPAPSTSTPSLTATRTPTALTPIPSTPGFIIYVVRPGDTLSDIAPRFGTTVAAIQEANPNLDPYALRVGQEIRIPWRIVLPTATPLPSPTSLPASGNPLFPDT